MVSVSGSRCGTGYVNRPLPSYFVLLFLDESSCETSHKKMGGIYMEKKLKRETHFHMVEFCTKGCFSTVQEATRKSLNVFCSDWTRHVILTVPLSSSSYTPNHLNVTNTSFG